MLVSTSVWSNDLSSVSPRRKLFRSLALLLPPGSNPCIPESSSSFIHIIPWGSLSDPSLFCSPDAWSSELTVCLYLGTLPSWCFLRCPAPSLWELMCQIFAYPPPLPKLHSPPTVKAEKFYSPVQSRLSLMVGLLIDGSHLILLVRPTGV